MMEERRLAQAREEEARKAAQALQAKNVPDAPAEPPEPEKQEAPEEEQPEPVLFLDFRVWGTREQLMRLRQYLIDNGLKFGKVE